MGRGSLVLLGVLCACALAAGAFGAARATILGTNQADVLKGTPGNDQMIGRAGNDTMYGYAGNDNMYGDAGDDRIGGGPGDDKLYGGDGNDILDGNSGNDRLYGGAGNDVLYGEGGDDVLVGQDGNDRLYGGAGNDLLVGGPGNDVLVGGPGNDRLTGGPGNDLLVGGPGNDIIVGWPGTNRISCGPGDDTVIADTSDIIASDCEHVTYVDANGNPIPPPKPPPVPTANPQIGHYSGTSAQSSPVTLDVASVNGPLGVANIVFPITLDCLPTQKIELTFSVPGAFPVGADGSFGFDGPLPSSSASGTLALHGRFYDDGSVSGTMQAKADLTVSGTAYTCTSDTITWSASLQH